MSTNPLASVMIYEVCEEGGTVEAEKFRPRDWLLAGVGKAYFVQAKVAGRWHTCGYFAGVAGFKTAAKRDVFLAQLRSGPVRGDLVPQLNGPADRSAPQQRSSYAH